MATTKKETKKTETKAKTTKKTEANDDLVKTLMEQVEMLTKQLSNIKAEETKKEEVKEKPKTKRRSTFADIRDREVEVQRVIGGVGQVKYKDKKTGDEYTWNEFNDTEYLTVDVLKRMNSQSKYFLKAPWLKIVDDKEVIEVLGLEDLYEKIRLVENIDEFMKLSDGEMYEIVNDLSKEYKDVLSTNVMFKIQAEELTNINVINKMSRILGKEFV